VPETTTLRLAGVEELAELLGLDEEVVLELPTSDKLHREGTPFPEPMAGLDQGAVWDLDDVDEWLVARRDYWKRSLHWRGSR
jgi:hypothetical protein